MAIAELSKPLSVSVYGLRPGFQIPLSEGSEWTPSRIRSLNSAIEFYSNRDEEVPLVAPLAELSAALARFPSRLQRMREAARVSGTDRVVAMYERQTALFLTDAKLGDSFSTAFMVTGINPENNQVRLTSYVFNSASGQVLAGESVIRMVGLKPKPETAAPERTGYFTAERKNEAAGVIERLEGDDLSVGDFTKPPSRVRLVRLVVPKATNQFAAGSRDRNGLHLNRTIGSRTFFKGRIAHGMYGVHLVLTGLKELVLVSSDKYSTEKVRLKEAVMDFKDALRPWDIVVADIDLTRNGLDMDHSIVPYAVSKVKSMEVDDAGRPLLLPVISGTLTIAH